jgi:hypothetical protein
VITRASGTDRIVTISEAGIATVLEAVDRFFAPCNRSRGEGKGQPVGMRYEYKFVRLGQYWGSAAFGVRDKERDSYQSIVHEHAQDGWRLVQIFAPGIAAFGAAKYYELIFERESAGDTAAP